MTSQYFKNGVLRAANLCMLDAMFRYLNRNKLLVVMYHGVTATLHDPPIWTQLPVELFREQLEFLRRHYVFLSLDEVLASVRTKAKLPARSALITFDDGLKNNYTVAFPVLQEMGIPAAVFLTVGYIGTDRFLWVDDLYLIMREAAFRGISLGLADRTAEQLLSDGRVWESYEIMVEALKLAGLENRTGEMDRLRKLLPAVPQSQYEDFSLLGWEEVHAMYRTGLIQFGVHTATHRILSELAKEEWEREIAEPKYELERELGTKIDSFCFPNGRPLVDFRPDHLQYLRKVGYSCAFSTENALFDYTVGDFMQIGRIPAGNDFTSKKNYFQLNASGAVQYARGILRKKGMACADGKEDR